MLHRLLLAAIVGASVLAHGRSVAHHDNLQTSTQDTEVIAIPWQGQSETELQREGEVDLEIRLSRTEQGKEDLRETEDEYELSHELPEVPPMPFPIGHLP